MSAAPKLVVIRTLEDRVKLDNCAGYHQFYGENGVPYGSFEVYWQDCDHEEATPGWYWHACFPGCIPDSEAVGPFHSSHDAYWNAQGCD